MLRPTCAQLTRRRCEQDATDAALGDAVAWAVFLGPAGAPASPSAGNASRYFDGQDSTAYEGESGAFATQAFAFEAAENRLTATIAGAVASGGFALPATKVRHSIELRGRSAPDSATMGGAAMACRTVAASAHSLARPAGTVLCSGGAAVGLGEPVAVVLTWGA